MLQTCNGSLHIGLEVASGETFLLERGADEVYVDDGSMAKRIREVHPLGVDRILERLFSTRCNACAPRASCV